MTTRRTSKKQPPRAEIRRVVKERLAERMYERLINEQDSILKGEAGKDLIRAIFGKGAVVEDPTH